MARVERSFSELFAVDEVLFKTNLGPFYRQVFEPRTILQFSALLPFHVPVAPEPAITFFSDHTACTYQFRTHFKKEEILPGVIDSDEKVYQVPLTVCHMAYVTAQEVKLEDISEDYLTDIFELLLNFANLLFAAYVILEKDLNVSRVSRERLPYAIPYKMVQIDAWDRAADGLFLLHFNLAHQRKDLTQEEFAAVARYAIGLQESYNPFFLAAELDVSARRHLRNGSYREAVIDAQTSVETMLSSLFVWSLKHEGKTQAEAEAEREKITFHTMITTAFHPRLGGRWYVDKPDTEVGGFFQDTYRLRNRIVHAGYSPSFDEATRAFDATMQLSVYVVSLIWKKKKRYPDLWVYFNKRPGREHWLS